MLAAELFEGALIVAGVLGIIAVIAELSEAALRRERDAAARQDRATHPAE